MSRVYLLAADKPLPLCDRQAERTSTMVLPDIPALGDKRGAAISCTALRGFCVSEHTYYRHAVDILNYPIKPYQYELELELHEDDLRHLLEYLSSHFSPGETVELWSIWVGIDNNGRLPPHYTGKLADFDMDTLEQLLKPGNTPSGIPGQCRLTVTV